MRKLYPSQIRYLKLNPTITFRMKKEEKDNIGKAQDLTKANGIRYYEFWYGKEGELGERDKRELAAKEKEAGIRQSLKKS